MPKLIDTPAVIQAAGNKPKRIEEFVGNVNTESSEISVAKMTSPSGWVEPGQTPEFREITYVMSGELHVEHKGGILKVRSGKRLLRSQKNGYVTVLPLMRGLSISLSACQPFLQLV